MAGDGLVPDTVDARCGSIRDVVSVCVCLCTGLVITLLPLLVSVLEASCICLAFLAALTAAAQ